MKKTTDITQLNKTTWQHKRGTIGDIVSGSDDIKQCLKNIMLTEKGKIPFMPELGTNIIQAIGEKAPDSIDIAIAIYSRELPLQEPRVKINSISGEYTENGEIYIKVKYSEIQTGIQDYCEVYI